MKDRLSNLREPLAFFLSVLALIAMVCGFAVCLSPMVARWTVTNLAWIKGVRLDQQFYGLPRSVLWESQVRHLGLEAGVIGLALGLSVLLIKGNRRLKAVLYRGLVFVGAFWLAYRIGKAIELPFSNPLGVVGPFTMLHQNPLKNTLQYLLLVLVPAAAVTLLEIYYSRVREQAGTDDRASNDYAEARSPRKWGVLAGIAAWVLVAFTGGATYTWHHQDQLDVFHEGETLGAAVQWEAGQAPYRDFALIHGVIQDPLRSVVAFELFGRSIASSRTVDSILLIVSHFLFAVCTFHVFNWRPVSAALAMAFLLLFLVAKPFNVGFVVLHRDIPLFLFLLSTISLFRVFRHDGSGEMPLLTHGLLFLCALIPVASFAYSIDRGYFLVVGSVISVSMLQAAFAKRFKLTCVLAVGAGGLAGIVCLGVAVRWQLPAFISYTFAVMPKVHELGFGLPSQFYRPYALVPILLTAFNASWIARLFVSLWASTGSVRIALRRMIELHFVEVLLLLMSVLLFKSALGRASDSHTFYSSGLTFLLTSLIMMKGVARNVLHRTRSGPGYRKAAFALVALAGVAVYLVPQIDIQGLYRLPLGSRDEEAIPPGYRPAIAFLRDSVARNEKFLTLTSEGIWYYLLNRPSPTRFGIAVYAFTLADQREFVSAIDSQQVDYVLYSSSFAPIDGIPLETRLPLVANYIREHYEHYRMFGDQDIWRRKDAWKAKSPDLAAGISLPGQRN